MPGKATLSGAVQRRSTGAPVKGDVKASAESGLQGSSQSLPHLDKIQSSFGMAHQLSGVEAHVGGPAADACADMGASGYATGNQVAFAGTPDLHTAAHEAAHVVQQRGGVQLKSDVGEAGDAYERNADAVADRVVAGQSASDLLGPTSTNGAGPAVQKKDKHKDKDKVDPKEGEDAGRVGQAVANLHAANTQLDSLDKMSLDLMNKAQAQPKRGEDPATKGALMLQKAQAMAPASALAKTSIDAAWLALMHEVQDLAGHQPVDQAKHAVYEHPGMAKALHDCGQKLAHYLSNYEGAAELFPEIRGVLQSDAGGMSAGLGHAEANAGQPSLYYKQRISTVEIVVSVAVVNLGSGKPRDQIQEAVMEMAVAWNLMCGNFTAGIEQAIGTVSMEAVKQQESGFMSKIWEKGEELLKKGAEFATGTALGATIGLAAIKKILAYGEELEATREKADKEAFITKLRQKAADMQLSGVKEGGNVHIHDIVDKLDQEFVTIGKTGDKDDEWKAGDQGVVGKQADFLKNLQKNANSYVSNVPPQAAFNAQFLTEFINANHKEKASSAWRSPFAGSTHWDGYVELNLTLEHMAGSGFFFAEQNEAKLHCPGNSGEIARSLKELTPYFSLNDLPTNLTINIEASDEARDKLPGYWGHDREQEIMLNENHSLTGRGNDDYWNWLMKNTGQGQYSLLSRVSNLK